MPRVRESKRKGTKKKYRKWRRMTERRKAEKKYENKKKVKRERERNERWHMPEVCAYACVHVPIRARGRICEYSLIVHRRGYKHKYTWARARATDSRCAQNAAVLLQVVLNPFPQFFFPSRARSRFASAHKGNHCARDRCIFASINIRELFPVFSPYPLFLSHSSCRTPHRRGSMEKRTKADGVSPAAPGTEAGRHLSKRSGRVLREKRRKKRKENVVYVHNNDRILPELDSIPGWSREYRFRRKLWK